MTTILGAQFHCFATGFQFHKRVPPWWNFTKSQLQIKVVKRAWYALSTLLEDMCCVAKLWRSVGSIADRPFQSSENSVLCVMPHELPSQVPACPLFLPTFLSAVLSLNKCLDFPSAQVTPLLPLLLMVEELAHPMRIERAASLFHPQFFEHLKISCGPPWVGIKRSYPFPRFNCWLSFISCIPILYIANILHLW